MANKLGPIDVCCDAPPYPIVQACEQLGFMTPLDVRWCRPSHFLPDSGQHETFVAVNPWRWFGNRGQVSSCTCGETLPVLETYAFTLASRKVIDFRMGQCRRCSTIFWEEG